jgi:hypothetical protein
MRSVCLNQGNVERAVPFLTLTQHPERQVNCGKPGTVSDGGPDVMLVDSGTGRDFERRHASLEAEQGHNTGAFGYHVQAKQEAAKNPFVQFVHWRKPVVKTLPSCVFPERCLRMDQARDPLNDGKCSPIWPCKMITSLKKLSTGFRASEDFE